MRQVRKCSNKVEQAENKGLGLAMREREYGVWWKSEEEGKHGTGTEGSHKENLVLG